MTCILLQYKVLVGWIHLVDRKKMILPEYNNNNFHPNFHKEFLIENKIIKLHWKALYFCSELTIYKFFLYWKNRIATFIFRLINLIKLKNLIKISIKLFKTQTLISSLIELSLWILKHDKKVLIFLEKQTAPV